jgi:glyoxylase-like metal-dependent hydrolase (beta-lactamase superfamily II)
MRVGPDGRPEKSAFPYVRPYRMTSEGACGFIAAEGWSKSLVAVLDPASGKERWSFAPPAAAPAPPLPDPVRDFPEFAESFGLKTEPPIPCRVAASVASMGDSVAVTDYGGWITDRKGPVTGKWDPPYRAIPFVPRQRGIFRLVKEGKETAQAPLPEDGLFELRVAGSVVWAFPASWFARGMAGATWLPADKDLRTVYAFDGAGWAKVAAFPDAVADLALHPAGDRAWVSCWDGNLSLLHRDGQTAKRVDAGGPARVRWSPDGSFAVAGTESGEVLRLDGWRTKLPTAEPKTVEMKPVFEGIPIYAVGRVGPEHAYVGDTWLVKTGEGGFLVDAGGTSALPQSLQKIRAAGVDPSTLKHLLHSHSHGDHSGGAYLWRARGLRIVAPETAALATTWLMPTVTDYGVWVPRPVDVPLPLKKVGDEVETTVEGLKIRAVFVPGHSYDSVVYLFELGGKRIAFTGDLGFKGQDILHRCWGHADKAAAVTEVIRTKVLEFRPDVVFTGHDAHREGTVFLEDLVARSLESIRKAKN